MRGVVAQGQGVRRRPWRLSTTTVTEAMTTTAASGVPHDASDSEPSSQNMTERVPSALPLAKIRKLVSALSA